MLQPIDYITQAYKELKKTEIPLRVVSLFSGCGGLDLSFHKANYEAVFANDSDADCVSSYRRNVSNNILHARVEELDAATLPEAELVIGGWPCQDFSQIGPKIGISGKRGRLYTHFIDAVRATKPKVFIAENGKGIFAVNGGGALRTILKDCHSIGYDVEPLLVNFADYGVPQFRERVLFIGVPHGTRGPDIEKPLKTSYISAGRALSGIPANAPNQETLKIHPTTVERLRRIPAGGNYKSIPQDDPLYMKGGRNHVYRRIDPKKPATTLIANGGGGTWGYHYPEPRALTNRERARLQGFPDDFEFVGGVSSVRRQIGNAVPPVGMIKIVNAVTEWLKER